MIALTRIIIFQDFPEMSKFKYQNYRVVSVQYRNSSNDSSFTSNLDTITSRLQSGRFYIASKYISKYTIIYLYTLLYSKSKGQTWSLQEHWTSCKPGWIKISYCLTEHSHIDISSAVGEWLGCCWICSAVLVRDILSKWGHGSTSCGSGCHDSTFFIDISIR